MKKRSGKGGPGGTRTRNLTLTRSVSIHLKYGANHYISKPTLASGLCFFRLALHYRE
jgi:hypothetical protein